MNEKTPTPRKTIIHRATLAPGKPLAIWTVADLRQFVQDCDAQGIPDSQLLRRDDGGYTFAVGSGPLIAERITSVD